MQTRLRKAVAAAVFLAVGMVLPLLTMQIKEIGDTLLPMHLPVLLCGFLCGAQYGGTVGLLLPFLRGAVFGMPPLYPNAVWMAVELATYGLVAGLLYARCRRKTLGQVYLCLIAAQLAGRVAWGLAKTLLLGLAGKPFTLMMFLSGGFVDALPGIILQILLIPPVVHLLSRVADSKKQGG